MIYLSAQPDTIYFLWQIQLQIFNFCKHGIKKSQIHILVGYNTNVGLNVFFTRFIQENPDLQIFTYTDTRTRKKYESSIRPHIISKHFKRYPWLEKEIIFYHDSDILFTKQINWSDLLLDDIWYASDTRNYLNSKYIKHCIGEEGFKTMCNILNIDPKLVEKNDNNAGGAQYIIKNVTLNFWIKVESDCEKLFDHLEHQQSITYNNNPCWQKFQIWCTDMWVIWWNALLLDKKFRIHKLLDFCVTESPVLDLKRKMILHYTGKCGKNDDSIFDKTLFQTHPPFYINYSTKKFNNCSSFIINNIENYRNTLLNKNRKHLENVVFIFIVDNSEDQILKYLKSYYLRYFEVKIFVGSQRDYFEFIQNISNHTLWFLPNDIVIPINCILDIYKDDLDDNCCIEYKGFKLLKIDSINTKIFSSILDIEYLLINEKLFLPLNTKVSLIVKKNYTNGSRNIVKKNFVLYKMFHNDN